MTKKVSRAGDLRPEYHFDYSKAVRGKYHKGLAAGATNVVVLDSDVAKSFRDSASVNVALRAFIELKRSTQGIRVSSSARGRKTSARRAPARAKA